MAPLDPPPTADEVRSCREIAEHFAALGFRDLLGLSDEDLVRRVRHGSGEFARVALASSLTTEKAVEALRRVGVALTSAGTTPRG